MEMVCYIAGIWENKNQDYPTSQQEDSKNPSVYL